MTNYTIGPNGPTTGSALQAIQQPGRDYPPITIYNTGAATVYLGNEAPRTSTDGIPLSAGSVMPWDENLALFAVCPTSTTLQTSPNSSVPFDAGAVAGQLITQGLPAAIAAAISITGAPPIDKFQLIYQTPGTIPAPIYDFGSDPIDVSSFQSITIVYGNGSPVLDKGQLFAVWKSADDLSQVGSYDVCYVGTAPLSSGGMTTWTLPVKGPTVRIRFLSPPSTATGTGFFSVYGSYKAVPRASYNGAGAGIITGPGTVVEGFAAAGVQTWSGGIPFSNTIVWQPDTVAGEAELILRFTTAGTLNLLFGNPQMSLTTYRAISNDAIISGDMRYYPIRLPAGPVNVSLTNVAASGTMNFRAVLTTTAAY